MTEKELEKHLVQAVKNRNGICYKFNSPGHSGVPDRLVLFPGGKIGFIEVKSPEGGKLKPLQVMELKRINNLGFKCFVLNSPERINAILDDIQR